MFPLFVQAFLMIILAVVIQPSRTATYHNYLSGRGFSVVEQTVGILELYDGTQFLSDTEGGSLRIIITYGELEDRTLAVAMRGESTCRIIVSHVMNPETSVSYNEEDLRSVLTHEIGHCFGMDHFKDDDHVMYWAYDGVPHNYKRLSKFIEDLRRFREPFF